MNPKHFMDNSNLKISAQSRYLHFTSFHKFTLWDVKRYLREPIQSNFPIVQLGKYIIEQNHLEKIFNEPDTEFKILGVNNKVGIFDAYKEKGYNINQPYKKVEKGWLAYNPYRINVGSIGIKNEYHQYEYISPAYVVFSCKKELLPDFLFLLFKTEVFNKIIKENTTGSVRQNLLFDSLRLLDIPLPSLEQQLSLLSDYNSKVKKADVALSKSQEIKIEAHSFLIDYLGVKYIPIQIIKGFNVFSFQNLDRWGVDFLLKAKSLESIKKCKFPTFEIGRFIKYLQYGISEKANLNDKGTVVLRMNNIQDSKLDTTDLKYIDFESSNLTKNTYILEKGDLLFNRTNSKELVGKTALFDLEGEFTFASYLIRIRFSENINPKYINYLFNSQIGRLQIDMISRQILGQANINSQELKEFVFPIPALKIQNEIVQKLDNLNDEKESLFNESIKNRKQALANFEKAVFNSKI